MSEDGHGMSEDGQGLSERAATCAECGTDLVGLYCHTCGQRRLGPEDRRLPHLLGQAFAALTDLDGRWLRSLWLLLVDTGALSRAYLEGRRQRYLKPISLFLLVNLLFFLSPPISDFDLHLQDHFDQPVYGAWAEATTRAKLEGSGVSLDDYTDRFGSESSQVAKSLVVLHVPVLAFFLVLGAGFRRWYYAEHVVVGLHLFAFLLLAAQLLRWVILPILAGVVSLFGASALTVAFPPGGGLVVLAAFVLYGRGVVRAYGTSGLQAVALVSAALVGLAVSHLLYRFTQFLIVSSLA